MAAVALQPVVGLTAMVNACCRDVGSARSRDILAGAVHAGLLQKIDPLNGQNICYRPLGLVERSAALRLRGGGALLNSHVPTPP